MDAEFTDIKRAGNGEKRLILIGGFLGAGKTTLMGKLVKHLQIRGTRCGVITNDQASGLVDTAMAGQLDGAMVSEISGGCFCCKLDELTEVLGNHWNAADGDEHRLEARAPEVMIAEPVGSCTDLMATVLLPLERAFGETFRISPLSVVVDGRRALASLGGKRTPGIFSKDVGYIYRKQLEEAEIVVVNKKDVMPEEDLADLLLRLEREYPEKEVFVLSARTGEGLEAWAARICGADASPQRLMDVDYERYGVGEALLGWCNAEVAVECAHPMDGDDFLRRLADGISTHLSSRKMEVAHFKMALMDDDGRLGVINQVMSGSAAEISRSFGGSFRHARLTVNLRAEGDPELLRAIVEECIAHVTPDGLIREMAAFRPGQPVPVERVVTL